MKINKEVIEKALKIIGSTFSEGKLLDGTAQLKIEIWYPGANHKYCDIVSQELADDGIVNTNVFAYTDRIEVTLLDALEGGGDLLIKELVDEQPKTKLTLVK